MDGLGKCVRMCSSRWGGLGMKLGLGNWGFGWGTGDVKMSCCIGLMCYWSCDATCHRPLCNSFLGWKLC